MFPAETQPSLYRLEKLQVYNHVSLQAGVAAYGAKAV